MVGPVFDTAELAAALADEALHDDGLENDWDQWASHWEKEFSRLNGLEEQWKKRGAERICMEAKREFEYANLAEIAAKAKETEEQVEDMRREQARQRLTEDATQQRKQAVAEALGEGDDMVRLLSENAAKRRLANEARRKQEREAAREAQWRRFHEAPKQEAPKPPPMPGMDATPSGPSRPPPRPRPRSSSLPTEGSQPTPRPPPVRFGSFAEFDAHWARFEQRASALGARDLRLVDVPWPTSLTSVSGISASDSLDVRKRKLRAALVRWHPDKWHKLLECIHESDRTMVVEKVKEVTRRIIDEKKRYGS